jgi:molecular chaperone DnaK
MYEASQAEAGEADAQADASGDDVVDADFEEIDDDGGDDKKKSA